MKYQRLLCRTESGCSTKGTNDLPIHSSQRAIFETPHARISRTFRLFLHHDLYGSIVQIIKIITNIKSWNERYPRNLGHGEFQFMFNLALSFLDKTAKRKKHYELCSLFIFMQLLVPVGPDSSFLLFRQRNSDTENLGVYRPELSLNLTCQLSLSEFLCLFIP